jgi:hypothetical protein
MSPKPHSLTTYKLKDARSRKDKIAALGPFAARWGNVPKGTVLPETQVSVCPRVKVADLPEHHLKKNHIEALEQNQKIASCCRHPEDHEVEALKSHPDEELPDTYIFYCICGRKHRFFCVGAEDERPGWSA